VRDQDAARVMDELVQVFRRAPELNLDDLRDQAHRPTSEKSPLASVNSQGKTCCH
jgi:hypothetical protein